MIKKALRPLSFSASFRAWFWVFFAAFFVLACAEEPVWTVQINADRAQVKTADVVVVRSPAVLAMLSDVTASRWFQERDEIIALWGDDLQINHYQLVPLSRPFVVSLKDSSIKTVLIYEKTGNATSRREAARL